LIALPGKRRLSGQGSVIIQAGRGTGDEAGIMLLCMEKRCTLNRGMEALWSICTTV